MNKRLPTNDISNELAGSSVFFAKSSYKDKQLPSRLPPDSKDEAKTQETNHETTAPTVPPRHHDTTSDTTISHNHEATSPKKYGTTGASNPDGARSSEPDAKEVSERAETVEAALESVRKQVKRTGKEAATHRFTSEEKRALADIVYTYSRQGYRTSENEITRIAINWLLLNYQEEGVRSVLARLLDALHG